MKSKIVAIQRTEKEIFLVLEYKSEDILENLSYFLGSLGFSKFEANKIFSRMGDSEHNYSQREYSNELYTDSYFFIEDDNITASIFFGKEKLMLALVSKTREFGDLENIFENLFTFPE